MHKWNGVTELPPLITLFSAPNYCDAYNNKAAIIKIDVENKKKYMVKIFRFFNKNF